MTCLFGVLDPRCLDVLSCMDSSNPEFLVRKARDLWKLLAASSIDSMPVFTSSAGKDTRRLSLMSPASSFINRRCRSRSSPMFLNGSTEFRSRSTMSLSKVMQILECIRSICGAALPTLGIRTLPTRKVHAPNLQIYMACSMHRRASIYFRCIRRNKPFISFILER
jgi:hypothetical protein